MNASEKLNELLDKFNMHHDFSTISGFLEESHGAELDEILEYYHEMQNRPRARLRYMDSATIKDLNWTPPDGYPCKAYILELLLDNEWSMSRAWILKDNMVDCSMIAEVCNLLQIGYHILFH